MDSTYSIGKTRHTSFIENLSEDSRDDQMSDEENNALLNTLKKKTLKDYDRDLKGLKEENFDLKIRIYMLEEKLAEKESQTVTSQLQSVLKNKLYASDSDSDSEQDFSELNSTNKSSKTSHTNDENDVQSQLPGTKYFDQINLYDSDSDKENLPSPDLDEDDDDMKENLKQKELELEASRQKYEELEKKFETFKAEYSDGIQQIIKEKYEKHINALLDEKNEEFLKCQKKFKETVSEYEIQIIGLNQNLQNKTIETECLKKKLEELEAGFKTRSDLQKREFLDEQMAKERRIQNLEESLEVCKKKVNNVCNNILNTEKENDSILNSAESNRPPTLTLIDTDYKDASSLQLTKSAKNYYQIIIFELENQLSLKENLIEQYAVALRTKEAQFNKLLSDATTCDRDSNEEKLQHLEALIAELRNSLNEKDFLYEKTLRKHFDIVEQKDSLILTLQSNLREFDVLIQSQQNQIAASQKEITHSENLNKELSDHIELGKNSFQKLMNKYQFEMNDKQEKMLKMKENFRKLKEKFQLQSDDSDLTRFSDEQLSDESFLMSKQDFQSTPQKTAYITEETFKERIQDYKVEIVNLSQKLKEKEATIKNLIASADDKDNMISRLKYLAECKDTDSPLKPSTGDTNQTRIETQRRKIEGLLKLIQEKNQTIDNLKCELNDLKQVPKVIQSICLSDSETNTDSVRAHLEILEKEIQIYKNFNASKDLSTNTKHNLNDIAKLRNNLIQRTLQKELNESTLNSSAISNEYVCQLEDVCTKSSLISFGSTRLRCDSMPDSGILSERSSDANKNNKGSSIPRLVSATTSRVTISPTPTSPTQSTDENTIQKLNIELSSLRQELNNKRMRGPKVIEIHNELSSLREKYEKSERLNEYLRKQIEIYHITHGNLDSLLEMAQKLNMTKEELEQYKEKLSKIQVISDSLGTNQNANSSSDCNNNNAPTRQIKLTISALEAQLNETNQKYNRLKNLYDRSERACRYLAIKFGKSFSCKSSSQIQRASSCPNLLRETRDHLSVDLEESQFFKLLITKYANPNDSSFVDVSKKPSNHSTEILNLSTMSGLSTLESNFVSSSVNNLTSNIQRDSVESKYFDKLFYIYSCFKNLKTNTKYLNGLFGMELTEAFRRKPVTSREENLIQEIFNQSFNKFDELHQKINEKDIQIKELTEQVNKSNLEHVKQLSGKYAIGKEHELSKLSQIVNSNRINLTELKENYLKDFLNHENEKNMQKTIIELELAESIIRNSFTISKLPNDLEINHKNEEKFKTKMTKYKEDVARLKSKISGQNQDIEEALRQLTETNREKEHLKRCFSGIQNEIKDRENNELKFKSLEPDSKLTLQVYKLM